MGRSVLWKLLSTETTATPLTGRSGLTWVPCLCHLMPLAVRRGLRDTHIRCDCPPVQLRPAQQLTPQRVALRQLQQQSVHVRRPPGVVAGRGLLRRVDRPRALCYCTWLARPAPQAPPALSMLLLWLLLLRRRRRRLCRRLSIQLTLLHRMGSRADCLSLAQLSTLRPRCLHLP